MFLDARLILILILATEISINFVTINVWASKRLIIQLTALILMSLKLEPIKTVTLCPFI